MNALHDIENSISGAVKATLFCGFVTAIFYIVQFYKNGPGGITLQNYGVYGLDILFPFLMAFGIWHKNRVCAILNLVVFTLSRLIVFSVMGYGIYQSYSKSSVELNLMSGITLVLTIAVPILFAIAIISFLIDGVQGSIAYHRLSDNPHSTGMRIIRMKPGQTENFYCPKCRKNMLLGELSMAPGKVMLPFCPHCQGPCQPSVA